MRYASANWKPITSNFNHGMMNKSLNGLVLHITDGKNGKPPSLGGIFSTFNEPGNGASAHFCVAKDGEMWQFIDTGDRAWAIDGSVQDQKWISVENIALPGEALTTQQIEAVANLYVWMVQFKKVPFEIANTPGATGLGGHSMFGDKNRTRCPGDKVLAQRTEILEQAKKLYYRDYDEFLKGLQYQSDQDKAMWGR